MVDLDLHINGLEEWPALADLGARVRTAAEVAFGTGELSGANLSISFVPRGEIRALNRVYHGVDTATDVLAFDLGDVAAQGDSLLGDIYICPDVARGSAATESIEWSEEVLRLVIHGVLHLLGHDHPAGDERYESEMFRLQEELLSAL